MNWKTIAITGASSGLGWQLALELASKENKLLLLGRERSRLAQLKELVTAKGAFCEICSTDLLSPSGVEEAIAAIEAFGPALLVHSAGVGRYGHFSQVPIGASCDVIRLNVLSIMEITHAWANMVRRTGIERPKVLFIASAAAFLPFPGMAVYAASKSCLLSFAEAFRYEERGRIDVLTVCPGHFKTNFQKRAALSPLGDPATEEALCIAKKIIRRVHKNGVYTPFPWNVLLLLRKLLPKSWYMNFLEKRLLTRI